MHVFIWFDSAEPAGHGLQIDEGPELWLLQDLRSRSLREVPVFGFACLLSLFLLFLAWLQSGSDFV